LKSIYDGTISDAESGAARLPHCRGNAATRPVRQITVKVKAQEEELARLVAETPGSWKTWRNSGGSSTRDWIR